MGLALGTVAVATRVVGDVFVAAVQTARGPRNREQQSIMRFILQSWHLLASILAGWINEQQQARIEFLLAEVQVLKEKLGKKRIVLNDDQRCRLAVTAKVLGDKMSRCLTDSGNDLTEESANLL